MSNIKGDNMKSNQPKKQDFITLAFTYTRDDDVELFKQVEEFTTKNYMNRSEWIKSLVRKELQNQAQQA